MGWEKSDREIPGVPMKPKVSWGGVGCRGAKAPVGIGGFGLRAASSDAACEGGIKGGYREFKRISAEGVGRAGRIRTADLLVPNQALFRAKPPPAGHRAYPLHRQLGRYTAGVRGQWWSYEGARLFSRSRNRSALSSPL